MGTAPICRRSSHHVTRCFRRDATRIGFMHSVHLMKTCELLSSIPCISPLPWSRQAALWRIQLSALRQLPGALHRCFPCSPLVVCRSKSCVEVAEQAWLSGAIHAPRSVHASYASCERCCAPALKGRLMCSNAFGTHQMSALHREFSTFDLWRPLTLDPEGLRPSQWAPQHRRARAAPKESVRLAWET